MRIINRKYLRKQGISITQFDDSQIIRIDNGLAKNMSYEDIATYADPKYTWGSNYGLIEQLLEEEIAKYANLDFDVSKMAALRNCIQRGINIDEYMQMSANDIRTKYLEDPYKDDIDATETPRTNLSEYSHEHNEEEIER